jgi:hypothetical protein
MMYFDVMIPWWWCTLGLDLCFVVIMVGFCYDEHLLFACYNTLVECTPH